MNWAQAVIVYFVSWWLLWFMALPIGIRQSDASGAPENPRFAKKIIAVMVIAGLATWGIDLLIHSGIVAVR